MEGYVPSKPIDIVPRKSAPTPTISPIAKTPDVNTDLLPQRTLDPRQRRGGVRGVRRGL